MEDYVQLQRRIYALLYLQARQESWLEWTEGHLEHNLIVASATDGSVEYEVYNRISIPRHPDIIGLNQVTLSRSRAALKVAPFRYDPLACIVLPLEPITRDVVMQYLNGPHAPNAARRFRVPLSEDIAERLACPVPA